MRLLHLRARPGTPRRRALPLLAALGLVATGVPACSARPTNEQPPVPPSSSVGATATPAQVAAQLAAALTKGDVSPVAFDGASGAQVQPRLSALVAGMGSRPSVGVGAVEEQGDRATAALRYSWAFPGVAKPWAYDTSVTLVRTEQGWRPTWAPSMVAPDLDEGHRLSLRRELAPRGLILGAGGEAIVKPRRVVRIGIDKTQVSPSRTAAAAARLAALVHVDAKSYAARVSKAGAADFVVAIVLRAGDGDRPSDEAVYAIDGAVPQPGTAMLAPSRTFARALLGTVDPATAETVRKSSGQVIAGDEVGRSGLQRRYDEQLRGAPGVTVRSVPAPAGPGASPSATSSPGKSSTPSRSGGATTLFAVAPVRGRNLALTLSSARQRLAERVLADTKPASALVAIRPSSGAVLAAANGPGAADAAVATLGRYPPGSTFKVASSLALLRAGLRPDSAVRCPAKLTVNGKSFTNYSDYPSSAQGIIDLRTALAQSCNTAFLGQRGRLRQSDLARAAASLGVGTDYDVGYPSYFGSVPADPTATGRAAAMIGQGRVLASPLSMAAVAASVSAGRTVVPQLVVGHSAAPRAAPLTPTEARQLRDMMAAVVTRGSGRVLRGVAGTVIAKTGTAEYGPKPPFRHHAWMIAARGDLAVAVFVERGQTGSHTAGPLLRRYLAEAR